MSPNLIGKLGERSLYKKIENSTTYEFAEKVWSTWKLGRNQVFHYFPHNLKAVSFEQAEKIVGQLLETMEEAYEKLKDLNFKAQMSNVK